MKIQKGDRQINALNLSGNTTYRNSREYRPNQAQSLEVVSIFNDCVIDIGTVMNKLSDTVDELSNETKKFGLKALTADGSVREMVCRKNVKSPRMALKKGGLDGRGGVNFNLKMNGLILVFDEEAKAPRSIKAACILQFRDFKKTTWEDVKH